MTYNRLAKTKDDLNKNPETVDTSKYLRISSMNWAMITRNLHLISKNKTTWTKQLFQE